MTVVALVAAKDAAGSIGATVRALAALPGVEEVWVVDDGSVDATSDAAREAGARVVRLDENQGKGGALTAGCVATPHADRYLLADADLGATASGLLPLLALPAGILGVGVLPSAGTRGGFGAVKRFARAGIRRACGVTLTAPLSGQRVVEGALLRSLALAPRFGVEVGMTIDAARAGVKVVEVPVEVDHRHTGRKLAGFEHRARQGYDIAGALLSRLSSERQRVIGVVAAALAVVVGLSTLSVVASAPRGHDFPRAERVVLFAYDRLRLGDLDDANQPALRAAAAEGVVGALSVRTTDRRSLDRRNGSERPSLVDAYASLGASARVHVEPAWGAGPGARPISAVVAAARSRARDDHAASLPGALGDALHAAGHTTALVVGRLEGAVADTPAWAGLVDRRGRVDAVEITPEPSSAQLFADGFARQARDADVLLVDPGSVVDADLALAAIRRAIPPRTALVVFSPTPPGDDWDLTPVVVETGERGRVVSPATRREGLAVLTDLAPTVLDLLGVPVPDEMTGSVLRRAPGRLDVDAFERVTDDGAARTRFFLGASVGYTVAALVFYLVLVALLATRRAAALRGPLRLGACSAAAFPLALLVTGAVQHWLRFGGESPVLLVVTCVGIALLVVRGRGLVPVYACAAVAVAVIAVDVAMTGPIHTASLLGYSLQTTGRFYGLPNASFAVFATSLLLVAVAAAGGMQPPSRVRAIAGAAVLSAGVAFVAVPWLGNDIGGTLALAPVATGLGWAMFGRPFTARVVLAGGVVVAGLIAALLGLERVAGDATHLAEAFSGAFGETLRRRAEANLGLLVDQWWGFPVFALALAGLVVARRGSMAHEAPPGSPLRAGIVAALALSLLAFVANDSGPVVSVLCLVVAAPVVALRSIDRAG